MLTNFLIFYTLFSILFLGICRRFNILMDKKIEKHKKYSSKNNSHLLGGLLILFFLSHYYFLVSTNYLIYSFLFSFFLIGIMADTRGINSVSQRFILQLIITLCFVNLINIEINYTKISFFDEILEINLINTLFVTFCLLVLINGTNFLDGINGLVITYYIIIFLILLLNLNSFIFDQTILKNFIFVLLILLLLNFSGLIYLGDSGSYTLSLFSGLFLINLAFNNNSISPYFIVLLLWYPCFELLFSMIRRYFRKIKTYKPDTIHLHQMVYKNFKFKINTKNNLLLHILTNLLINFYNLISFIFALRYIYNSEKLILIIVINITVYILAYNYLNFSFNRIKRK